MRIQNVSLIGLFAIMTCVALSVSHALTSYRLWRSNTELSALRKRLELIPVENSNLVAVRRLPSTDETVRRWAIRIPNNCTKVLYANWGSSPIAEIQNVKSASVSKFPLKVDSATREIAIQFSVQRNPNNFHSGSLNIVSGNQTTIAVDPETTSLLMGERPCRSEGIGDAPTTRSLSQPIILFATESNDSLKTSFCLWLDDPIPKEVLQQ